MPSGYSSALPSDVLLDQGLLYIDTTPWGASVGAIKFDPGTTYRNVGFAGKRVDIAGLDRVIKRAPKFTGQFLEFGPTQIPRLEDGTVGVVAGGVTTYTPRTALGLLPSGIYLANVSLVFSRAAGGYVKVRFPLARITYTALSGAVDAEAMYDLVIEARQSGTAPSTDDPPYVIELVSPGITISSVTVTPNPAPTLTTGNTQQFTRVVRDTIGNDVTSLVGPGTWSVAGNPVGGGTISASGLLTGTTVGDYIVSHTVGGVTGTASGHVSSATDIFLAGLATDIPGSSVALLLEADTGLVTAGSNVTSWTDKNGIVFTPDGVHACTLVGGAVRGVLQATGVPLNLAAGMLTVIVSDGYLGYISGDGDGMLHIVRTDATRDCTFQGQYDGTRESNRGFYNDGSANLACTAYAETTGERTVSMFNLKPGGTRGSVVFNEEKAGEAALGGTALWGSTTHTLTINKGIFFGSTQFGKRDIRAILMLNTPGATDAQIKAGLARITRQWCGGGSVTAGKYPLPTFTKKRLQANGDSLSTPSITNITPAEDSWITKFATTRAATWSVDNHSIGGFRMGNTVAGATATGDRTMDPLFDLERQLESQWLDCCYHSLQRTAGDYTLFATVTNDEANETAPPMDTRLGTAADRRNAKGQAFANIVAFDMLSRTGLDAKKNTSWGQFATVVAARSGMTRLAHTSGHVDGTSTDLTKFTDGTHQTRALDNEMRDALLARLAA